MAPKLADDGGDDVSRISKEEGSKGKDVDEDMEGESDVRISRKRFSITASVGEDGPEIFWIDVGE
jgi:hypothetical protein